MRTVVTDMSFQLYAHLKCELALAQAEILETSSMVEPDKTAHGIIDIMRSWMGLHPYTCTASLPTNYRSMCRSTDTGPHAVHIPDRHTPILQRFRLGASAYVQS